MTSLLKWFSDFDLYRHNSTTSLHSNYRYRYAFSFERVDDPIEKTLFLQKYWHYTITISILYFAAIKLIQYLMKYRTSLKLQYPLIIWNISLALFSIVGFIRFSEDLLSSLLTKGIYVSLCYSVHPNDVAAYWSLLFAISKLIELGDTLFIVFKKKPLIFLHYYHHAAVLVYTVHSGAENTAAGRAFISMNFFAHSVMYTYYAFTASRVRPSRWISMGVTSVQTMQMLMGVAISVYVYKIKIKEHLPCQQSMGNLYLAFIIYITFAALFVHFFIKTYIFTNKKMKKQ